MASIGMEGPVAGSDSGVTTEENRAKESIGASGCEVWVVAVRGELGDVRGLYPVWLCEAFALPLYAQVGLRPEWTRTKLTEIGRHRVSD